VGPAASCDGVPHGQSEERTRYEVMTVPYGQTCPKEVQTHTCDNGFWSDWTGSFVYESCEVGGPQPCDSQPHGTVQSYTAYAQYSVEYGGTCLSEVRTRVCNNGVWTDWTGSYEAWTCTVKECAAGMSQSRSCGLNNRGTQTRPCLVGWPLDGKWDPNWGACIDPDVCKDGADVPSTPCNGGLGWEPRTCVNGQYVPSGTCGACTGKYVDPCGKYKTEEACFKDRSCTVWIYNPTPHCARMQFDTTQCRDLYAPKWCSADYGCSWTWL
jgi:hypothetical protein